MRPPFTYTFGEVIDKLSIISKKEQFGLQGAKQELDNFMKWLNDIGVDAYLILSIIRVTEANMSIWNLEHELRNAKDGDIPLDKVGRIAIKVREHNKARVRYMNELDSLCGAEHITEKVKHLSEDIYDKFYKRQN
jgi:hypothetical protein